MNQEFALTAYKSLYDIDAQTPLKLTWEGLVDLFGTHARHAQKDLSPGFGPYRLRDVEPPEICRRHTKDKTGQHRCDALVEALTLAVFDVDTGTEADVAALEVRLKAAGYAYLLYSSYSYGPAKAAYRLVLPLKAPVSQRRWPSLRTTLLHRFAIPADPKKCSGASHFYYLPSCPPESSPAFRFASGSLLDADVYVPPSEAFDKFFTEALQIGDEEETTEGVVDLKELRRGVRNKANGLKRREDAWAHEKAELLENILDGKPLAASGSRNDTTAKTAWYLVWNFPDATETQIKKLLEPSVLAMQREGSSLRLSEMYRMVYSAKRKQREEKAAQEAASEFFKRQLAEQQKSYSIITQEDM